ncbi:MAG: cell surface protein SprA [Bacteroidetes bacterium]|nr:cell surface protein SprA [Bacteroidota bacterium]
MRKILFLILIGIVLVIIPALVESNVNGNDGLIIFTPPAKHWTEAVTAKKTSPFVQDSSAAADSLSSANDSLQQKMVPLDTAFLNEQFPFQRTDNLSANPFDEKPNPFILGSPSIVQTEVKLDSTGKYVIVRQMLDGKDIRLPQVIPVDEYVKMRAKKDFAKNFSDLIAKEYPLKKKKNDLGDLLGAITNIDIPIPANPVFSIFGPPRINLTINGAVDIRAAFRNTTTDQLTTSVYGNSRNEPDFGQEVQINVSGTVGDKLNILADWNTQRTFEYENQLRIKYTGYEDEIVQSVEAGNVSLATNSSFVSSSSALFGIKAGFQFGPLKLTAIASQKKGQIQEKTVSGGSQEITFEKRAWEYSKDHFFIDTVYINLFEDHFVKNIITRPDVQIKDNEFEVFVQYYGQTDLESKYQAQAFIDLPPITVAQANDTISTYADQRKSQQDVPGSIETGIWEKLVPEKDYRLNLNAGILTMNRTVQDGQAIAIAYRIENGAGNSDDLIYGTMTKYPSPNGTPLVLKLVKPKNLLPQYKHAWQLQLRNIYPLGGRKIQEAGFEFTIKYAPSGQTAADAEEAVNSVNWVQIFGLDKTDASKSGSPDGKFDYIPNFTIDPERGEVIFPMLKPFTEGIQQAFKQRGFANDTTYMYNNLYDTTVTEAQKNDAKNKFILTGKITASSSNSINLGFNVVEGSVQVLLDGQPLTPNVDYTVDYIIGQVIIKNQAALVPGANLSVKFEQNDLFQLASKTLLGIHGDIDVSEKTKFGFTIMNLDQQTLSDKVRLNEEPINNTIFGIDGQTSGELNFVTKAIDALPLIDTKAKSEFTLRGEAAFMNPDPNTKKSPIPDDGQKGIAYIDDFEGAKRIIPLGVSYGQWHDMSVPRYQYNVDSDINRPVDDTTKMKSKARTFWYNPPMPVLTTEIYGFDAQGQPVKKVARGQDQVTTLSINFNPLKRGEYNFSMNLDSTLLRDPQKNWGGIQHLVSTSTVDMIKENINYIEIWVRVLKGGIDSTKKVFIDLGSISEDVIPNGKLDTEEKGIINGILNEGEDTGIDGLTDDQEREKYKDFIEANKDKFPELAGDPSGDNWAYSQTDFTKINGTENNKQSEIGRFPDTEDLNGNNVVDKSNNYFEYELSLDTTDANPYRVGGGSNSWYQYRIPVSDFKNKIGAPDFSLIETVRLWMTNHDQEYEIRIAEFNLIGNQWEELKKNDSSFSVSVVNIEDNYNQGYTTPSGVVREQDKTKPGEQVFGNEQSLALLFHDLKDGETRQAIKRFSYKPLDVFSYRQMKMFVHGDNHFASEAKKATAKMFIRFGSDSLNYYEYRAPVYPGWDPRNDVKIIFSDLTAIKQGRDSATAVITKPVPNGQDSATYSVLGNPTLTRINYISIGVENPASTGESVISGQIWVNELRLIDPDDTPGWAYSVSTTLKLADLGSVAFTYSQTDPYFHRLEDRVGSRVTSKNWNFSSNFYLEKFLPQSWQGTSLPFSYSHSEQMATPLYLPSSDVVVTKASEQQQQAIDAKKIELAQVNQQIADFQWGGVHDSTEYKQLLARRTRIESTVNTDPKEIIIQSQTLSITETYALPTFRISVPSQNWFFKNFVNRLNYGFNYNSSINRSPATEFRNSWQWNARIAYSYTFDANNYLQPFDIFEDIPILSEFKNVQLYFIPFTNFNTSFSLARSRTEERFRNQTKNNPIVRGLSASRNLSFSWKLTENGLLNLSGDYSVDIASTLLHLELDRYGNQRSFLSILDQMFMKDQLIYFGTDNSYTQSFSVNTKPRMITLFDLNKYVSLSGRYQVGYRWQYNPQQGILGISTGWSNSIGLGTDISLKQFVESWWPVSKAITPATETAPAPSRRRSRHENEDIESAPQDETQSADTAPADSVAAPKSKFGTEGLLDLARIIIKTPFFDYDKINISFTQTNNSQNGGVLGRPGFANFFGRAPLVQNANPAYGPSRAYQLGLVTSPSANITDVAFSSKFPFVKFSTDADEEVRAPRASLNDAYSQSNKIQLRTSRDLWKGARVDLNWNLGWDFNQTRRIQTDRFGRDSIVSVASSGSVERSFFTMPPVFVFSMFKSGIEDVGKQYTALVTNTNDKRTDDRKLSEAFETGFESLPILKKLFSDILPRLNYTLRWDGLEEMALFKKFATRVSLDHGYNSTYRKGFKIDASTGDKIIESQRIAYGFAPLIGLNISFKELLKGTMSANLRYSANVNYDLTPASKNIVEGATREMSFTASYGRSGFEIPLFGLTLQNDVDLSFSYTYAKNTRITYDVKGVGAASALNTKGIPGEGSSTTTMEPRIRYVLSSRVTASLFYRYRKIAPDEGGSKIPGSTTNEGGLDVHISIQ